MAVTTLAHDIRTVKRFLAVDVLPTDPDDLTRAVADAIRTHLQAAARTDAERAWKLYKNHLASLRLELTATRDAIDDALGGLQPPEVSHDPPPISESV